MNGGEIKKFGTFRSRLYKGDKMYVGTADFISDMLLRKSTDFARLCEIVPVVSESGGVRHAQALWVHYPPDGYASLAFFDCEQNNFAAANEVISSAFTA